MVELDMDLKPSDIARVNERCCLLEFVTRRLNAWIDLKPQLRFACNLPMQTPVTTSQDRPDMALRDLT